MRCLFSSFVAFAYLVFLAGIRIAIKRLRALLDDLDVGLVTSRDSIVARYRKMWSRTDQVFGLLKEGSFLERPITLRHPFIFYLGHVAAFAWNQMVSFLPSTPQFDAELAQLFERGIDPDVDTGKVNVQKKKKKKNLESHVSKGSFQLCWNQSQ